MTLLMFVIMLIVAEGARPAVSRKRLERKSTVKINRALYKKVKRLLFLITKRIH